MTHDFHYYVAYMCARNAGYDVPESLQIAYCSDLVDGGTMNFISKNPGKYGRIAPRGFYPLTVYEAMCGVNNVHSEGSSILTVPWMAFHFLPSFEVTKQKNIYFLTNFARKPPSGGGQAITDFQNSTLLESGLICTKDSRFAKALIQNTAELAQDHPTSEFRLATLGVRAHVIADLWAHSGFAGCRSMAINSLNAVNNKELAYELEKETAVSMVKNVLHGRLGHGQAGQRPDEPYVRFDFTRTFDKRKFEKDNWDLFGEAFVALSEVLRGRVPTAAEITNWYDTMRENRYVYQWYEIFMGMNRSRTERRAYLRSLIWLKEMHLQRGKPGRPRVTDLGVHDGTDYWAFGKASASLLQQFSNAADAHLKWFHETCRRLTGVRIDQYLDVALLYPGTDRDDQRAQHINATLLGGGTVDVKDAMYVHTEFKVNGYQIGSHHMEPAPLPLNAPNPVTPTNVYKFVSRG